MIKICGTTNIDDALLAQKAGADYFGVVVEHAPSPRSVSLHEAVELRHNTPLPCVALTVNKPLDFLLRVAEKMRPAVFQLHGDESPQLVRELAKNKLVVWTAIAGDEETVLRRAAAMREAGASAILLDARATRNGETIYGGTGERADWKLARRLVDDGFRVILAGGLSPQNVAEAIEVVKPWGVDCASGVETKKGRKNAQAVQDFVFNARAAS
ncbi:MAG TPA: phosphoribosylanthranilate isomerase [Abditibacteriaceae bacterium]|jgi:phosphoribosylanthranilate isomerase